MVRAEIKFPIVAHCLSLPFFYCLQTADMEDFRKVFNALEIENKEMLRLYFHESRKNFESVVFVEKEFLHNGIQKEDESIDLTATPFISLKMQ